MLFNSIDFVIFFPIVILVHFIMHKRYRYIWLLLASYYFYMCWNAKYALLLFTSTVITYLSGLLLKKVKKKEVNEETKIKLKKMVLAFCTFRINGAPFPRQRCKRLAPTVRYPFLVTC